MFKQQKETTNSTQINSLDAIGFKGTSWISQWWLLRIPCGIEILIAPWCLIPWMQRTWRNRHMNRRKRHTLLSNRLARVSILRWVSANRHHSRTEILRLEGGSV